MAPRKPTVKVVSVIESADPALMERATPAHTATVFTDRRIALLVVFLVLVVGAVAAAAGAGLAQNRTNHDVLNIIKDATDPSGVRYQQGQAQTAAAVAAINEITVLAVYCGKAHAVLPDIQGCVRAEWARAHPPTTTTTAP